MMKLTTLSIAFDNSAGNILKSDDIEDTKDFESCLLVRMSAVFDKQNGFAETEHNILNEDKENWCELNRPMKEWIGAFLLEGERNPSSESRLQYNSLLSRAIGEASDWEQKFGSAIKYKR